MPGIMGWVQHWSEPVDFRPLCIRRDGGEVFVAGPFGACVLDAETGKTLGKRSLPGTCDLGMPFTLTDELLLVPMPGKGVWALARRDLAGRPRWCHPVGPGLCGVAVSGGAAFVSRWADPDPLRGGGLARLGVAEGNVVWERALGFVATTPTVAEGIVCAGFGLGGVRALGTANGADRWVRVSPPDRVMNQGHAVAHDGRLYFNDDDQPGADAAVYALDLGSGKILWREGLDGELPHTNVLLDGDRVFTAGVSKDRPARSTLFALRAGKGTRAWTADLRKRGSWAPAWGSWLERHKELIHLHTESGLRCFRRRDGQEEKPIKFPEPLWGYRIEGDWLYAGTGPAEGDGYTVSAHGWG